jgi:hypothetical protein
MAAFVLMPSEDGFSGPGSRLAIFPGSATPSVFPAEHPFWVGYGFVPFPLDSGSPFGLDAGTRFELEVDGELVPMEEDVTSENGHPASKRCVARFGSGLPAGWHRFAGRWYDGGSLVLTTDRTIQFLEP